MGAKPTRIALRRPGTVRSVENTSVLDPEQLFETQRVGVLLRFGGAIRLRRALRCEARHIRFSSSVGKRQERMWIGRAGDCPARPLSPALPRQGSRSPRRLAVPSRHPHRMPAKPTSWNRLVGTPARRDPGRRAGGVPPGQPARARALRADGAPAAGVQDRRAGPVDDAARHPRRLSVRVERVRAADAGQRHPGCRLPRRARHARLRAARDGASR